VERRFSEEQVSEVIRRAAELSSLGVDSALARNSGVTESELRRIAREIGLDDGAVDAAMRETGTVVSSDSGGDLTYERSFERRINGEVGEEAYATLVEHFVPEWGIGRGTNKIGNLLTYRSLVGINSCQVSVSQKAGRTTLRVTSSAWISIMATYLPATALSITASILVFNTLSSRVLDKFEVLVPLLAVLWIAAVIGNLKLVRFSNRKVARLTDAAAADLAESADHLRSKLSVSQHAPSEELEGQWLT
jgi:hypothetical protein